MDSIISAIAGAYEYGTPLFETVGFGVTALLLLFSAFFSISVIKHRWGSMIPLIRSFFFSQQKMSSVYHRLEDCSEHLFAILEARLPDSALKTTRIDLSVNGYKNADDPSLVTALSIYISADRKIDGEAGEKAGFSLERVTFGNFGYRIESPELVDLVGNYVFEGVAPAERYARLRFPVFHNLHGTRELTADYWGAFDRTAHEKLQALTHAKKTLTLN